MEIIMDYNHMESPHGQLYIAESALDDYVTLLEEDLENVNIYWLKRSLEQNILHHYAKTNERLVNFITRAKLVVSETSTASDSSS
jgi:hypothetical protein